MFTGLIETSVPVLSLEPRGAGAVLTLAGPSGGGGQGEPSVPWQVAEGDSVACSGCCLTVSSLARDGAMTFELSAETLEKTWLGQASEGTQVNLERALRLDDRLGGHLVSGHVDGVGRVAGIQDPGDGGRLFTFAVGAEFERWLIQKGSVTVDGISLTVVDPRPAPEATDEWSRWFDVAVIPETLARTSLGVARVGDPVHLEGDLVGKWIERLVQPYRALDLK